MSITIREFSRPAVAFGTALVLVTLPLTLTIAPAHAATTHSPTEVETPTATADATDDSPSPTATSGSSDAACADPNADPNDGPCEASTIPLRATWTENKMIKLPTGDTQRQTKMPESWIGEEFAWPTGPRPTSAPVAPQSASASESTPAPAAGESTPTPDSDGSTDATDSTGETDDSGQPIEPDVPAASPKTLSLDKDGYVINPTTRKPMVFRYTQDPKWEFEVRTVSGAKKIVVFGTPYDSSGTTDDANGGDTTTGGSGSGSGSSSTSSDAQSPGGDSRSSDSADSGGSGSSATEAESSAGTNGTAGSRASAQGGSASAANADSAGAEDSGADARTGGSGASSADGSDSGSAGEASENRITEAPSTGNGSGAGRDIIPGDTGDEWLPGAAADGSRPDYSDPVPHNPESPTPDDDTDLITGGGQPDPRRNNQAASSFGESFVSTIVSSWPVFVLAASGMAAVGFILFLVGRRGRTDG